MAKIEVRYKIRMSKEEMENFKKTWTQPLKDFLDGLEYKYRGIQLGDSSLTMYPFNDCGNDCVAVYGHNHIHLGDLKADHGCLSKGFYYPILRFYNKLNYEAGFFAYNQGQPTGSRKQREQIIWTSMIFWISSTARKKTFYRKPMI